MASYYYLIASLPTLTFDGVSSLTVDKFMALCQEQLSKSDYRILENLFNKEEAPLHPFVTNWREYNHSFEKVLTNYRMHRLQRVSGEGQSKSFGETDLVEVVKAALNSENPLQGELVLLKHRWNFASFLAASKYFELEVVLTYAIQLEMVQRRALFKTQEGTKEFESLFKRLQTTIKSI